MPQIRNHFIQGKMEQDLDSRLIPNGQYRDALNVKVSNSSGNDVGAIENSLSNKQLTNISVGSTIDTIGMYFDSVDEKIYWFIVSDLGSYIIEYDIDNQTTSFVLEDTSVEVLNFSADFLITGVNLTVDSDNNIRLLNWTDNLNPPRQINVDRAKTYGANNFTSAQISLIKPPPLFPPTISLTDTTSTGTQNNIEERFIRFSYRYRYLDGELSALSPFTEVAFDAKTFFYDYSTQSNESMINAFNQADISFNTGSDLVTQIDIVFKDSNSNTVYLVNSYIKGEQGWGDDITTSISFVNNKVFQALDEDQLFRLYDAVPLKAKAQELIGNRLIFGNYTENYNIVDCDDNTINITFTTEIITADIDGQAGTPSLKSNRDYEIGIVYVDEQGRMTTVLTSDANTVFIPNSSCILQNQILVTLSSLAPCWASKYRFFIKQTRTDYDVITPTVFYNDGLFVWVLLQGNESNKVSQGEFIYVKADTGRILPAAVQTRVLEITTQPVDFLDNDDLQIAGTYMKVKPTGYDLNEEDYDIYEFSSYDSSSNANDNPLRNMSNVIEPAVFYGDGLNDMTSSGTYTGTDDIRYIVRLLIAGTPDTYEWSSDDGATFDNNGGLGFAITGVAQPLELGVQVTFTATTGHSVSDQWIVPAKAEGANGLGGDENSKAYAFYKSIPSNGNVNVDDIILGGSQIRIEYSETGEGDINHDDTYIVGQQYDNLEEWWYETPIGDDYWRGPANVWLRRGTLTQNGGAKYFTQNPAGDMTLIIRSVNTQNNDFDNRIKVYSDLTIISLAQNLIFETIPLNNNAEVFYEIGRTYDIDEDQFHLGFDGTDVSQSSGISAQLILPTFNCFAWGNGFESYKIKDLFNATNFKLDSRPLSTIDDYRENVRLASLSYSKVYEQTTNSNGLNEFNLATVNYKDLDDKFESIQKIYNRDTNLIVFQEDKIHRVPYTKNVLFNTTGGANVTQSTDILGTESAYAGEYGISSNPESFAFYGNAIYFTDVRRGVVCRLDLNGIIEISSNGMEDFFDDSFRGLLNSKKIGAFDLYNKQYVLTVDEDPGIIVPTLGCGAFVFQTNQTTAYTYIFELNNLGGEVNLNYDITDGTADITATFNSTPYSTGSVSGSGTLNFTRDSLTENLVTVVVTPVTFSTDFTIENLCPVGVAMSVVIIITNSEDKAGSTMTSRYKWDASDFYSEQPVFEADGITLFETYTGAEGTGRFPFSGSTVEIQAYKNFTDAESFNADLGNTLSYLVSSTVYTEEDITTIQGLATYPTLSIINEGGIPETTRASFTFTRTLSSEILYMIWDYTSLAITEDTYILMYFDSSGSMNSTLAPLLEMQSTLLKDALLPFYNNDPDLYDERVFVVSQADERTLDMLNANGQTPEGNLVAMVFQDEAQFIYYPSQASFDPTAARTPTYDSDLTTFRGRLDAFDPTYYRGVSFQVIPNTGTGYKSFLEAVQGGQSNYSGTNGLADKTEILWKYDITDGGTASYYLDQVTGALTELGFNLNP